MAKDMQRVLAEAIERKLRAEWDYIDLGSLHDEGGWQKLAEDAAVAAIELLAPELLAPTEVG